jgi:uncharacterized protein (TIGR02646 family)
MIKVNRIAEPTYLNNRHILWLKELRAARRIGDWSKFHKLQGRYGHEKIKLPLRSMFSNRCAYCESPIDVVATPHIEHFRPKHRYVSLTYVWTNLLLSCPKCNEPAHKGNKFPSTLQGGPIIDPTSEDPSLHFDFEYDVNTKLATIKPLSNRGEISAKLFGLNTRQHLLKARSDFIRKLIALKAFDGVNAEATQILSEVRLGNSEYQAWVRKYI